MRFDVTLARLGKLSQVIRYPLLSKALFRYGVLAGVEHRALLGQEFRTVVDVGANRGQFALAARQFCPVARVYSFEPLPGPADTYRSLFLGDGHAVLREAAIAPDSGIRSMHVSARDDSSSLLPIQGRQLDIFPETREVSSISVQVAPLDTFLRSTEIIGPALLKIDVQGFEYEVLCGSESLLSAFDAVYCECSFVELYSGQKLVPEVIEWLASRGFVLSGVFNTHYDEAGLAIQADFLFQRKI